MQQPPNPGQWQQQPYSQQQWQSPPPQWQQPPQLPPTQQPKKKKNWTTIIGVIGVVIAGITLIIGLLTWLHPFSPAPPHSGVQDTLTEYCNAVLKGDYQTAYNFSSKKVKLVSEEDFINHTAAAVKSHGGMLSCTVSDATDDGSTGHGIITFGFNDGNVQEFKNQLVMEDGSWKILTSCTPAPSCH